MQMSSKIGIALFATAIMGIIFLLVSDTNSTFGVFHNKSSIENTGFNLSQINNTNSSSETINLKNILLNPARGGFTSLHNDNNVTWITTGDWQLIVNPNQSSTQSSFNGTTFNATIDMVTTNNTGSHSHDIWGFKLTGVDIKPESDSTVLILNGTITMETGSALFEDVPVSIKIVDSGPIILSFDPQTGQITPNWEPGGGILQLWIDPKILPDHFGGTPVYGKVRGA